MAAGIQRLSRQALVTFMTRETAAFSSNFERLKSMLDSITAEDIKLAVPNHIEQSNGSYTGAPATHVSIFECPFFSLGVFILKKGGSIPLHDHPGMFGLCKVVYGKISVESYQRLSDTSINGRTDGFSRHPLHTCRRKLIRCRKTTQSFEETSESCMLTPTTGNHHAIHNISLGPSAFVDILGPPYAQDKDLSGDHLWSSFALHELVGQPTARAGGVTSWLVPDLAEFLFEFAPQATPKTANIVRLNWFKKKESVAGGQLDNCSRRCARSGFNVQGRDCTYYQECDPPAFQQGTPIVEDNNDRWITEIPPPRDFFCNTQPYSGPPVSLELISEPLEQ